ncbi:MAG TPA: hypothetical protein VFH06_04575 [Candidatus Saccharimonadales bacterium]|nr:hypothetical protein [Candidatus Saccharimonadales bacterium]
MIITKSPALKAFKKEVGQANHMLITLLVGLDGIIKGNVTISKEFHATWSPKDKKISAYRSRDFAKKSCLVWVVDCLDMYTRLINKSPSLIEDTDLKKNIDNEENNRKIYTKLAIICEQYDIKDTRLALVHVLICWRNRLTHYDAENDISVKDTELLLEDKEAIKAKYRGLDIQLALESFYKKQPPTFKEVASLVSASIDLVYAIDEALISELDKVVYADRVIIKYLKSDISRRLNGLFSNEKEKINKSLQQILMQNGFSKSDEADNEIDQLCLDISSLSFDEIKTCLSNGSFIR